MHCVGGRTEAEVKSGSADVKAKSKGNGGKIEVEQRFVSDLKSSVKLGQSGVKVKEMSRMERSEISFKQKITTAADRRSSRSGTYFFSFSSKSLLKPIDVPASMVNDDRFALN